MKLSAKQFMESWVSITALLQSKLSIYAAFPLRKFAKAAIEEMEALETSRKELIKKHGEEIMQKDAEGNDVATGEYSVPPQNMTAFKAEFDEFLKLEIELPNVKVKIRDLERAELSVGDIMNLDFILDQDDVEPFTQPKIVPLDQVTRRK